MGKKWNWQLLSLDISKRLKGQAGDVLSLHVNAYVEMLLPKLSWADSSELSPYNYML